MSDYQFKEFKQIMGDHITLVSLQSNLIESLASSLHSPSTFFSQKRGLNSVEKISENLKKTLVYQDRGERLTLVAVDKKTNNLAGMSTFLNPSSGFLKVEIGFTWIADAWQRTYVNSEMKLLMLNYAFLEMKVKRVEFSVDTTNQKSNQAMKRLGATFEGTLRKWRFNSPDDLGHRNIYSVIDDEWAELKERIIKNQKSQSV